MSDEAATKPTSLSGTIRAKFDELAERDPTVSSCLGFQRNGDLDEVTTLRLIAVEQGKIIAALRAEKIQAFEQAPPPRLIPLPGDALADAPDLVAVRRAVLAQMVAALGKGSRLLSSAVLAGAATDAKEESRAFYDCDLIVIEMSAARAAGEGCR